MIIVLYREGNVILKYECLATIKVRINSQMPEVSGIFIAILAKNVEKLSDSEARF